MNQKVRTVIDREARDTLVEALKMIRAKGWCQRQDVNETGARCLQGAVYYAPQTSYFRSLRIIKEVIETEDLIGWNDKEGRTQQEIEEVLEKAIARVS